MKLLMPVSTWARRFCFALMFAASHPALAQGIIYGALEPPITYSAGLVDSTSYIDINGVPAFAIISTSGFSASIAPLGNDSIIAIPEPPPDTGYFVAALSQGTSIGSSLAPIMPNAQWYNNQTDQYGSAAIGSQAMFGNQLIVLGYFAGQPSAYAGFDLYYDGADHYGWMQLQNPLSIVNGQVVDWAYESNPNTPIMAGEVREPSVTAMLVIGMLVFGTYHRRKCYVLAIG